ncbi:MAG: CopG family transcriptional regulator [Proteobacteria bacterium]|nr:CopG family transcriptional regulator [Pseudomonadota bacterium]
MAKTLNLSLTDDLRDYVDSKAGNDTDYSTPTEYVRSLIRTEKKADLERTRELGYQVELLHRAEEVFNGNYVTFEEVDKKIMRKFD